MGGIFQSCLVWCITLQMSIDYQFNDFMVGDVTWLAPVVVGGRCYDRTNVCPGVT